MKDHRIQINDQPVFAEIGYGNLNWKRIAAAEESGCQWFIVEQDTCPGDPLDSVANSCQYIASHLCA